MTVQVLELIEQTNYGKTYRHIFFLIKITFFNKRFEYLEYLE